YWFFSDSTGNYNNIGNGRMTGRVGKSDATIMVTPYDVTYDGDPHIASGTAKGVKAESLSGLDLSHTTHTNAGTYNNDYWSFSDSTGNYNNIATIISDHIAKADATVVVTPYTSATTTYDGNAHTATVTSITGVNGETVSTVGTIHVSHTTHTNASTYASDYWFFTGTANCNAISNTTITDSIGKANATVLVAAYDVTYNGNSHTATITSISGV